MPDKEEQAHPLGPTEELLAQAQAETMARSQQPDTTLEAALEQEKAQTQERREREQQEQREWEAKRDGQGQEQTPWLEAPQQEGTNSHPMPDTSPASPGREQHQQAVAEEAGESSGGMKRTISTKTQLGAVVTLDGVYVVPRYETVIKETPIQEQGEGGKEKVNILRQLAREQSSGQRQEQDKDKSRER